ncbi:DUF1697 domain-containing protein [Geodermatophilus sp. SYSU D00691]
MAATRYVALLRAINLARTRRVPMPRLRELLAAHGFGDVRTHLSSGNVVLDSGLGEAQLAAELAQLLEQEFGFAVPVVVRTGAQLADVVAADPLGAVATDPARYSVTFFPEAPDPARVAAAPRVPGAEVELRGRELYLWLPEGLQAARGVKWDELLGVAGTNRNWNTVTRLAELAR